MLFLLNLIKKSKEVSDLYCSLTGNEIKHYQIWSGDRLDELDYFSQGFRTNGVSSFYVRFDDKTEKEKRASQILSLAGPVPSLEFSFLIDLDHAYAVECRLKDNIFQIKEKEPEQKLKMDYIEKFTIANAFSAE